MTKKFEGDCADTGCIAPKKPRPIVIDYLYLDLGDRDKCDHSLHALKDGLDNLALMLNAKGLSVDVNEVLIDTHQEALDTRFCASPTVRIDGVDVEELCKEDCDSTDGEEIALKKVWLYKGKQLKSAPEELFVRAMLNAIYSEKAPAKKQEYIMPGILEKFFDEKGEK